MYGLAVEKLLKLLTNPIGRVDLANDIEEQRLYFGESALKATLESATDLRYLKQPCCNGCGVRIRPTARSFKSISVF